VQKLILLLLPLFFALTSCDYVRCDRRPISILFVGNSLTYVGNLPATFEALARQNHLTTHTDMIVSGGATLTQRVADQSVAAALGSRHYDYVVFQERGGDALCSFGPDSCAAFENSLAILARLAQGNHVSAVLLGTYQSNPKPSVALVNSERLAAQRAGIPYLAVSDLLLKGSTQVPDCRWFYADGMHPGHGLVLLDSVLLYKHFYDRWPQATSLEVNAPMFVPGSKFESPAPVSRAIGAEKVEQAYSYNEQCVHQIIALASKS
jgi:hypothetical protein